MLKRGKKKEMKKKVRCTGEANLLEVGRTSRPVRVEGK